MHKTVVLSAILFSVIQITGYTGCAIAEDHSFSSSQTAGSVELENKNFNLIASCTDNSVNISLEAKSLHLQVADGPYLYSAEVRKGTDSVKISHIENTRLRKKDNEIIITGALAGLLLEHTFSFSPKNQNLEEKLSLTNNTGSMIELSNLEMGLQKKMAGQDGVIPAELQNDRWIAVPFRHRADDPKGFFNDFYISSLFDTDGYEPNIDENLAYKRIPSRHRYSEGWAWMHGGGSLGIFKFGQENMEFSVVSKKVVPQGKFLRFGGACMISGEPASLARIAPQQKITLGAVLYESIQGGYTEALYAFRTMLDEQGCRFPKDYNPPVHWNQLYNMNEAWNDRANRYTKKNIMAEAAKAKAYQCEALYLDPGWDTGFGTFLWGEKWLGSRKSFVDEIKSTYGLSLALHCPLATWMSGSLSWGIESVKSWPKESLRTSPNPSDGSKGPQVCLGSKQYREEAEKRMLENCADGAVFLMFDGNWWNGGCINPDHGHPVPYRWEDHIQASLDLAQRVHARYPKVLIEMHDMLAGGTSYRITPVYYKYGLPGSYDDNWGFELMWNPLEDLKEGRGSSLYYYNMACNIPLYLHVDLRKDNENCLVLWWFASTCRHLGIGGAHENPAIAEAQKKAMQRYHELERFYKTGDFFGINEEIQIHALPKENAFVVNLFNLSDQTRTITGQMDLNITGINSNKEYTGSEPWGTVKNHNLTVSKEMPPWSAQVAIFNTIN